jgi:hypothetical protein
VEMISHADGLFCVCSINLMDVVAGVRRQGLALSIGPT